MGGQEKDVKSVTGVTGDGHRAVHSTMLNAMSKSLEDFGVPHRGEIYGKPPNCKDVFAAQVGSLPGGNERAIQAIIQT